MFTGLSKEGLAPPDGVPSIVPCVVCTESTAQPLQGSGSGAKIIEARNKVPSSSITPSVYRVAGRLLILVSRKHRGCENNPVSGRPRCTT